MRVEILNLHMRCDSLHQTLRQIEGTLDSDAKKPMKQNTLDGNIIVRRKDSNVKIREETAVKLADMNSTIHNYLRIPKV